MSEEKELENQNLEEQTAEKYLQNSLEDFQKMYPKHGKAYIERGMLYLKKGMNKEAFDDFTEAINSNDPYSDAFFYRGNIYFQYGNDIENSDTEKAKEYYLKALEDYTKAAKWKHSAHFFKRGLTYVKLAKIAGKKDEEEAKKYYQKAKKDFLDSKIERLDYYAGMSFYLAEEARVKGQSGAKEEYKEAVDAWNEILKLNPEYPVDYKEKAYAEEYIGDYKNAIKSRIKANKEKSLSWKLQQLADYYDSNREYKKAVRIYQKLIKLENKPEFCNQLAMVYCHWADSEIYWNERNNSTELSKQELCRKYGKIGTPILLYKKAIDEWNNILKKNPKYKIEYWKKADVEFLLGYYDDCLKDLKKDYKNEEKAYSKRAFEFKKNKMYTEAIADYTKLIEKFCNRNSHYFYGRGYCYKEIGKSFLPDDKQKAKKFLKKAKDDFEIALELYTTFEEAKITNRETKKLYFELVIEEFNDKIEDFSDTKIQNYLNRAIVYYEAAKNLKELEEEQKSKEYYQKAIEYWNKAESCECRDFDHFLKAIAEEETDNATDALKDYCLNIDIQGNRSFEALRNRGMLYHNMKKYEEAIDDFSEIINQEPFYLTYRADSYYEIALQNNEEEYFLKALDDWRKIEKKFSYYRYNCFKKAQTEEKFGNLENALKDYTYYINLKYEEYYGKTAYNERGHIYEQLGDLKKARDDYKKALEINPDDITAKNNFKRILQKLKND